MLIGIVDADLIGRVKHRFPNLVCEKISGYWKEKGADVELLLDYNWLPGYQSPTLFDNEQSVVSYDRVYVSKVFTDTWVPPEIDALKNTSIDETNWIQIGGTGFYFDKAPNLPDEIEHHMPDYHLYDNWIFNDVERARKAKEASGKTFNEKQYLVQYKEYLDYSIGFVTRGCFRKCKFCVNQKFDHVFCHSPLSEFYDPSRKKICMLDDNFLGYPGWKEILEEIIATKKPFKFKQGLDERLLTDEKCELLFNANYDGDFTFAFDNIEDYELIHKQLKRIRKNNKNKGVMFYVLVGFKSTDEIDIENAFKRIELLFNYRCLPYIMRYMSETDAPWKNSKYRSFYVTLARWCNQPSIVKEMTFRDFCEANQALHKTDGTYCSAYQAMLNFEAEHPEIAKEYFDIRFGEPNPKFADDEE